MMLNCESQFVILKDSKKDDQIHWSIFDKNDFSSRESRFIHDVKTQIDVKILAFLNLSLNKKSMQTNRV